jgi:pyruvate ferredoxin oxidoreductase gamma subunit
MFAVRIHGRGGQGVVTAAELLSVAVFTEGGYAQALPTFGSERTGAPVAAYCRIDTAPIRTREPIADPDAVIIADPSLWHQVDVLAGLRVGGYAIINTDQPVPASAGAVWCPVPATALAMRHLGRPVPNAVLLGAFAGLTRQVGLAAVLAAIAARFPGEVGRANQAAARDGYTIGRSMMERPVPAAAVAAAAGVNGSRHA